MLKNVYFVSAAILCVSCGSYENRQSGTNSNTFAAAAELRAAPTPAPDCNAAWKRYVASQVVGTQFVYLSTSKYGDTPARESEDSQKVIVATDAEVKTEYTSNGQVTVLNITKEQFLQNCTSGSQQPNQGHYKILEERDVSITVKAGTFKTHYIKFQMTYDNNPMTTTGEAWTSKDDSNFLVLSNSNTTGIAGGQSMTSRRELVRIQK